MCLQGMLVMNHVEREVRQSISSSNNQSEGK